MRSKILISLLIILTAFVSVFIYDKLTVVQPIRHILVDQDGPQMKKIKKEMAKHGISVVECYNDQCHFNRNGKKHSFNWSPN